MKSPPSSHRVVIPTCLPSGEPGQVALCLEELGARVFSLRSQWLPLLPTHNTRSCGLDQVVSPDGPWVVVTPQSRQEDIRRGLSSLLGHRQSEVVIPFHWDGNRVNLPDALARLEEALTRLDPSPTYVLLVGPARELPFVVGQYLRRGSRMVGRLATAAVHELAAYAKKVIQHEQGSRAPLPDPQPAVFVLPTYDLHTTGHRERVFTPMVEVMGAGGEGPEVYTSLDDIPTPRAPGPSVMVVLGHGIPPGIPGKELGRVYVGGRAPLTLPRLIQHLDPSGGVLLLHACCSVGASPHDLLWVAAGSEQDQDSHPTHEFLHHPAGPLAVVGHVDTLIHLESESHLRVTPDVWPLLHVVGCLRYHRPVGLVGHLFQHRLWELGLQLLALLRTPPTSAETQAQLAKIWLYWRGLAGWEVLGDPRVGVGGGVGQMSVRDGFDAMGYLAATPADFRREVRSRWLG